MSARLRFAAVLALFAAVSSCAKDLTEIVLVVDTDLAVPTEMDRVAVTIDGPSSHSESSAALGGDGATALPLTLGMSPTGGAPTVIVTAIGTLGGREVVRRFARATFVTGQRRMLYVTLTRSCLGVACPLGQTCGDGVCSDGTASALPTWTGTAPARLDASAPSDATDADVDAGTTDVADVGVDEPAPMDVLPDVPVQMPDVEMDVAPDVAPDVAEELAEDVADEPLPDVTDAGADVPVDAARADVVDASMCPAARADCDRASSNGCEVDTANDPLNCGGCGRPCTGRPNSSAVCVAGACGNLCSVGFGDCNTTVGDGCEASLRTTTNCGTCGSTCAPRMNTSATCPTGTCVYACAAGFGDCDGDVANGCETNLNTSTASCGGCGRTCRPASSTGRCTMGVCSFTCLDGFADCDGMASNGCEANLHTATTCGTCTTACPAPRANMTASCPMTSCQVACTAGFGDCDDSPMNGCEINTNTSATHCGACGTACATYANANPACVAGRCANACRGLRGDCDGIVTNGCELDVSNDASNCGGCMRECGGAHAVWGCVMGVCRVETCDSGFANCDGLASTGCEADLNRSATHCGMCGNACTAMQRCASGRCVAL